MRVVLILNPGPIKVKSETMGNDYEVINMDVNELFAGSLGG